MFQDNERRAQYIVAWDLLYLAKSDVSGFACLRVHLIEDLLTLCFPVSCLLSFTIDSLHLTSYVTRQLLLRDTLKFLIPDWTAYTPRMVGNQM